MQVMRPQAVEGGAGEGSQCRSCMGRKGLVSTPLVLRPGSSDGGGQYKECQRVTEGYGIRRCPPSCQRVQEGGAGEKPSCADRMKCALPLLTCSSSGMMAPATENGVLASSSMLGVVKGETMTCRGGKSQCVEVSPRDDTFTLRRIEKLKSQ